MKTSLLVFVISAFLVTPLTAGADVIVPSTRVVQGVAIRSKADGGSKQIGLLGPGDKTTYYGEESRWYKIRLTDGRYGYVSKSWTLRLPSSVAEAPTPAGVGGCGGEPMTVHFFNAGQALAALVQLPDGRKVLVDTGESATRPACSPCKDWSAHVMSRLDAAVGADNTISMLWITHQHSDHHGNAVKVLDNFDVENLVTNGTRTDDNTVKAIQAKAKARGTNRETVDPSHTAVPIADTADLKFAAVVPANWIVDCDVHPNDCSIGLRIDYCKSSLLFTGDAETSEEAALEPGDVTLLQAGHHGSDTSSDPMFLAKAKPEYVVISTAKVGEGTNSTYCHPRSSTVRALSKQLGDVAGASVTSFDAAVSCKSAAAADHWEDVPASKSLFVTARDGDVVLETTGDGMFARK